MKNKKIITLLLITVFGFVGCCFTGCKPYNKPDIHEIKSNETAFVIPLEGASKADQAKFDSVDFLNEAKVATKRISIERRWRKTGRLWWSGEYIPTARVITVSRTPETREWQPKETAGKKLDGGIPVESLDSIGFSVGINITAQVQEPDTATFLYFYPGKGLSGIIDTNMKADVQALLSKEFGNRDLEECKTEKNDAFEAVKDIIIDKYENYGIQITSFGLAGGLWYEDPEIQESINAAYTAEMNIKQRDQEKQSQIHENERLLSIAENQRDQAIAFAEAADARKKQVQAEVLMIQAEAFANAVKKWDGTLPKFVTSGNGMSMLMQIDKDTINK